MYSLEDAPMGIYRLRGGGASTVAQLLHPVQETARAALLVLVG